GVGEGAVRLERLARGPVEERELAARPLALAGLRLGVHADAAFVLLLPLEQGGVDVLDGRAVEDRRRDVDAPLAAVALGLSVGQLVGVGAVVVPALRRGPAEARLEDLADVHAARHAERAEGPVDRRAVPPG